MNEVPSVARDRPAALERTAQVLSRAAPAARLPCPRDPARSRGPARPQPGRPGWPAAAQRRQRIAGDADQPGHHDLRGAAERGDAGRIDQGKPVERSARGSFLPAARSAPRRSCHAGPRAGRGRRGRLPARGDGSLPAVPGTAPRAAPGAAGSARRAPVAVAEHAAEQRRERQCGAGDQRREHRDARRQV